MCVYIYSVWVYVWKYSRKIHIENTDYIKTLEIGSSG